MKKQSTAAYIVHLCIGLFMMFGFGMVCPTWSTLNTYGVYSIGILLGALWLVTHGFGLMGPSMLGFFAVIWSGYMNPNQVLMATLGNSNTYLIMMCLVLTYAFSQSGAGDVFARWMISRKVLRGRPMLFTTVFMVAMGVLGTLLGAMALCLLAFAIIDSIGKAVGYEEDSQWHRIMLTIIMIVAGGAGAVLPFKPGPVMVISMIKPSMEIAGISFNDGLYILSAFISLFLFIALAMLTLKPLFKVDLDKLKNLDVETLGKGGTEFNKKQAIITVFMVIGFAYSIITIFLPKGANAGLDFFIGIGLPVWLSLMVVILTFIRIDGEPVFNTDRMFGSAVIWGPVFAAASFMLIGTMMSDKANGVSAWLTEVIASVVGGLPFPAFIFIVILAAVVCTNFFSNSATAVILASIVAPFAMTFAGVGVQPTVFCAAIANSAGIAYLTMGAGGVAPVFLGLDCIKNEPSWIWKYGTPLGLLYVIGASVAYISCGLIF